MEDLANEVCFMQASTSKRLKNEWGNAICYHTMVDVEYHSNLQTGNLSCLICGKIFSIRRLFLAFYFIFLPVNYSQLEVPEIIKIVSESL
jgi:hypothetical protein